MINDGEQWKRTSLGDRETRAQSASADSGHMVVLSHASCNRLTTRRTGSKPTTWDPGSPTSPVWKVSSGLSYSWWLMLQATSVHTVDGWSGPKKAQTKHSTAKHTGIVPTVVTMVLNKPRDIDEICFFLARGTVEIHICCRQ